MIIIKIGGGKLMFIIMEEEQTTPEVELPTETDEEELPVVEE